MHPWVYISATQFDAPGDDRQNLNDEWVRLTNRGEGLVLLAGWTLSDSNRVAPVCLSCVYPDAGIISDRVFREGHDE